MEAIQGYHLQTNLDVNLQLPGDRVRPASNLYQRCELKKGRYLFRGGEKETSFPDFIDTSISSNLFSPVVQLQYIVDLLNSFDIGSYYRIITAEPIFVAQVIVPQLERLWLISNSIPVGPSRRARKFKSVCEDMVKI